MIVAFVTVLLGLTAGVRTIEMAVAEPVAQVELRLDGAAAGVLTGEPWRLEVDLGAELSPHRLVAIARAADGGELGRAEQWINMPHEPVEARLLLTSGGGPPRSARLIWEAVGQSEPQELAVSFDGEPLEASDPGRIVLPAYDPREMHFLRAELRFSAAALAVAEAAFGGVFGEQVATEIQALALALDDGARLPPAGELSGWLSRADQPLAVRAVDAGPADVMVVVDLAAKEAIAELQRSNVVRRPVRQPRGERADPNLPGYTPQPGPRRRARSRATARVALPPGLHPRDRLRFVYPMADPDPRDPYAVFPISTPFTLEQGGVFDLLARVNLPAEGAAAQRLADAVAIAGLHAYAGHRRRIVLVVAGERPVDRSRFGLPAVRRYLSRLRVPLVVWRLREPASDVYRPGRGSRPVGEAPVLDVAELGPAVEVSSLRQLKAALAALRRQLDAQRIVWVEGHHLPQQVELGAAAEGVRWAGGDT